MLKGATSLHMSQFENGDEDTVRAVLNGAHGEHDDDDNDDDDDAGGERAGGKRAGTGKRQRRIRHDHVTFIFDDVQGCMYIKVAFSKVKFDNANHWEPVITGIKADTEDDVAPVEPLNVVEDEPEREPAFLEWGFRAQLGALISEGGWKAIKGTGLIDWVYVRPGGRGAREGGVYMEEYFISPAEVQAFLASHGVDPEKKRYGAVDE